MTDSSIPTLLVALVVFLGSAVLIVPLTRAAGLGTVLGYLVAGFVIGPFGFGLVDHPETVAHIGELGVILLLFVIGLELDVDKLRSMRGDIFGLGLLQVMISGLVITVLLKYFWLGWLPATVAGFSLALSSTAVVSRLLKESGTLTLPYGRRAFSILLMQDIALVPFLAIIGFAVGETAFSLSASLFQVSLIMIATAFVMFAGQYLVEPLLNLLVRAESREIITAGVLLIVAVAALIMGAVGVSMALGAFLAGLLMSESSYKHTLEADIEPFRGLLLGLFFMSVGMTLEPALIFRVWPFIIVGLVLLFVIKIVVLWVLARVTGSNNADALRIAVTLGQGGEFGFVLFGAAVAGGLLSAEVGMTLVAVVAASMAITPLVISAYDGIAARLAKEGVSPELVEGFGQAHAKVLVLGYGRFGAIVGDMMRKENIDVVAIDRNTSRIRAARASGHKVYFGDITRLDVLEAAGAADVALIAICAENTAALQTALILVRQAFPDKAIFCRARDGAHAAELHQMGADFQVQETFESGIVFGRAALEEMGVPLESIDHVEDEVRREDHDQFAAATDKF